MSGTPEAAAPLTPLKRAFLAIEQLQARLEASERARTEPIAIIGMGCRFPGGADSPESFWRLLCEGFDAVTDVPADRWDTSEYYDPDPDAPGKTSTRRAGFVADIADFDPQFFGIAPREAVGMDPQQRMLLEVGWQALEHAGIAPTTLAGSSTGVFVGICGSDYVGLQLKWNDPTRIGPYFASGTAHSVASGRLSYVLGLQGPSISIDTACSSSLVAVHLAYQSLRLGDCRMALAGGAHAILGPDVTVALSKSRMLAPDGRCKAFDAAADGFVEGEGCGIVVMKRLSDAVADGDRVLAIIRGSACNQDGESSGLTVPNGPSQQNVIREALSRAGVEPSAVGFVETHGTGTPLGDPIEVQALGAVLGQGRSVDRPVAIGSVKTNIGHLQSAAGVAGLIKAVLMLQHGQIPPHLHLKQLSPYIPWDDLPVVVPTQLSAWPDGYAARIAGVTSLGFSGTNAHVIVEASSPAPVSADMERPLHLLALSARSESALRGLATQYVDRLDGDTGAIADVCFTANAGRAHFGHRIAVIASSIDEARGRLLAPAGEQIAGVFRGASQRIDQPRVAFLFTGQGSQYAGMARELYQTQPTFRRVLDRCAALLENEIDRPLLDVLHTSSDAASVLDQTAYTQPALFAVEYALAALWRSWGVEPIALLGHSVGEYAAACVAGVFSLEDGLKLIAARGRLMQALPSGGAMAAVETDPQSVARALAPYGDALSIAAINGPADVVISGAGSAMDAVLRTFDAAGIRTQRLNVSHAFHSSLMEPALDAYERAVAAVTLSQPRLGLISNLTGLPARDELTTPSYWRRHAREAVQFHRGVQSLVEQGCQIFVEIGPKPTLIGLGQRAASDASGVWIPSLRPGRGDWAQMFESLATLYTSGLAIDWAGFDRGYARRKVTLPTYPFERSRYWVGDAPPAARPIAGASTLPFGGRRLRSALREIQFEFAPRPEAPAFVADHRKYGRALFPATGFLEMIWAAASALDDAEWAIEDFVIAEPLVLEPQRERTVQVILTPDGADAASVQVFSVADSPGDDDGWRLHASGGIRRALARTVVATNVDEIKARCTETIEPAAFYARLLEDGHDYGATFQTVAQLERRDGEAFGRIRLAAATGSDRAAYRIHPTLLDGCLQTVAAALSAGEVAATDGDAFLPVSFDRIAVASGAPAELFAHVVMHEAGSAPDTMTADVDLLDDDGQSVGRVEGMHLRRFSRQALTQADGRNVDALFYSIEWQPAAADLSSSESRQDVSALIVLADAAGLGESLVDRLEREGRRARLVRIDDRMPLDPDGSVRSGGWADDLRRQLSEVDGECAGVVHLCSLDALADPTSAELTAAHRRSCETLLHVVQALAERATGAAPRLWVVTRGAQAIGDSTGSSVGQYAIWGLTRTIVAEHPELTCVALDLDAAERGSDLDCVARELQASSGEDQIAYRQNVRYVPRLVPRPASIAAGTAAPGPTTLQIHERGVLENLRLDPLRRRAPGAGEVEIEVAASGLNFRDVLNALGVYGGAPSPLGAECAGRIVAIGPDVTTFAVGQEVVAFAPGAFSSFVTTAAALVVAKPNDCSFADAAGVPVAFVTALHALSHLARLKAGERVLIHAASGGVGLAAVQIAQSVGAEIFATAGSSAKHEYLRSIGVHRIMSSRSLEFAGDLQAMTNGEGVDVVLNSLAGEFISKSLDALRTGGRFLEIGKAGIWTPEQVAAVRPDVSYFPIYLGDDAATVGPLLQEVVRELAAGRFRPLPVRTFPIEKASDAFRFMAQARHIGKVVLDWEHVGKGSHDVSPVRGDATYLITGGLGALGLEVASGLVHRGARHIVLAARRPPSAAAAARIAEIAGASAAIRVVQADVSRDGDVAHLFETIDRELPPLAGVVHAAGVVDDGLLAEQTWDRVAAVLEPKAIGAWNLHRRTLGRALDFFVLFSSTAAIVPSAGQGSYSAANAFLDGLAKYRSALGLPTVSVNWGPWAVGMAAIVGRHDRDRWAKGGIGTIAVERGLAALERVLRLERPQLVVWPVEWSKFLRQYPAGGEPPVFRAMSQSRRPHEAVAREKPIDLAEELTRLPANRRRAAVESRVRTLALRVLALDASTSVDAREPLSERGLDSLMAVELRNALGQLLGRSLPATLLFKFPTIEALTAHIAADILGLDRSVVAPADDDQAAAIRALDEGDAKRLLADELASLTKEPWFAKQS